MHNAPGRIVSSLKTHCLLCALFPAIALSGLFAVFSISNVKAQVNVPTYHGDNGRGGLNANEVILRPSLVNSLRFGKLFSYPVDGYTYAQPLYLSNIVIPGKGNHNVVIAATENDSVYAFDADDNTGASTSPLWLNSLIPAGEMVVTSGDVNTGDLVPVIGITGTPVIDQANGTLYVVAKTKNGTGSFYQRLHALDIHTGLDKAPPVLIQATATGIGDASVGGVITFNPRIQHQRSALLFSNGVVTIAWASHGDNGPYHGWLMNYHYDEVNHTFTQTGVFNTTPNGITDPGGYPIAAGGVWMAGGGPAMDSVGNIYFETGNGSFDASQNNFGDSFVKLTSGLSLLDYFTPFNQLNLDDSDADLGSGGTILLPDSLTFNGHSPLMTGAGKEGKIYLLDRNNLGQFNAAHDNILAELPNAIGGSFDTPAYFNNSLYYLGAGDVLRSFGFLTVHSVNPNYPGGFSNPAGLWFNSVAYTNGSRLRLINDSNFQAGSVFTTQKVNTANFRTRFHFQISDPQADGMTFTLQNNNPQALGTLGVGLGYTGLLNSIAIKFDIFQNSGDPSVSSTGLFTNGQSPVGGTDLLQYNLNLRSGHQFQADMVYNGTTLAVTLTDMTTNASNTQNYAINIPATIGSQFAYAGFTAGSGGAPSIAEILDWTYSASDATYTSFQQTGQGPTGFGFPGATPAVSSNGINNGIVWALQTDAYGGGGPAVLHAYDAANVATELYNSNIVPARDNPGGAVKFTVPTVANGKVFVGTANQLSVFGLLNHDVAELLTTYKNVRKINGSYALDVTISNIGNKLASNIQVTRAVLGNAGVPITPLLPYNGGTLLVGQSETFTMTFPAAAGKSGSQVSFGVAGMWRANGANTGKLNASFTVLLP